ncbi:hypothetical protein BS47DRAFT_1172710 [Hydnum rufescens UP504]|uniref:Uncharacterized protein n=1 Tax=Hydnum rufescens UP504 TaxID=1448309 RepID=A0A9P6AV56_9AGAM|nr:hypothetical protein BS47DRAFT_1172710 [Hydnum rufescens UP504]
MRLTCSVSCASTLLLVILSIVWTYYFGHVVRMALRTHGSFPAGHSLHSGSVTAYALADLLDDRIEALGCWSSDASKISIHKQPLPLHALIRSAHSSGTLDH